MTGEVTVKSAEFEEVTETVTVVNEGALMACIIGAIVLIITVVLLAVLLWSARRQMSDGGSYTNTGNSSMRSNNATPQQPASARSANQAKLDDMM